MTSWIVQAVPEQFLIDQFLEEYVSAHLSEPDWWATYKNKYEKELSPGNELYVWKGISDPPKKEWRDYFSWKKSIGRASRDTGIIAKGYITNKPRSFNRYLWEQEKYRKYRVRKNCGFGSNDKIITCIYEKPENIRVRNPIFANTLQNIFNQNTHTPFYTFLFTNGKCGKRIIRLDDEEAKIINSLFNEKL